MSGYSQNTDLLGSQLALFTADILRLALEFWQIDFGAAQLKGEALAENPLHLLFNPRPEKATARFNGWLAAADG